MNYRRTQPGKKNKVYVGGTHSTITLRCIITSMIAPRIETLGIVMHMSLPGKVYFYTTLE